jgi:hypothetical protein
MTISIGNVGIKIKIRVSAFLLQFPLYSTGNIGVKMANFPHNSIKKVFPMYK